MAGISKAERERRAELLTQGLKWCPECERERPLDDFTNDASRSDGKASKCSSCLYGRQAEWKATVAVRVVERAERERLLAEGLKRCGGKDGCNRILRLEEFSPAPRNSDGRATNCHECQAAVVMRGRRAAGVQPSPSAAARREAAIADLLDAGYTPPGDFVFPGTDTAVVVTCRCGNFEASVRLSDVRKGQRGCAACHRENINGRKHANTVVKVERIIEGQPEGERDCLLSAWLGPKGGAVEAARMTWIRVVCGRPGCGYEWNCRSGLYLRGTRCPVCAGLVVVPGINDLATRRPDLARQLKDQSLGQLVTVSSAKKLWWVCFNPECGRSFEARVSDRSEPDRGSGCPYCSETGYKVAQPGALYVVFGSSRWTGSPVIKFGIANTRRTGRVSPLRRRLREHSDQGLTEVLSVHRHEEGRIPWLAERALKRRAKRTGAPARVSRDDLPDGFTEAFVDTSEARDWLRTQVPKAIEGALQLPKE
jgi:hypothetical protein